MTSTPPPEPQVPAPSRLRCCLLSGGGSRRMGTDKALLPHPRGGTWLEHSLAVLAALGAPISLCSADPQHRRLALQPQARLGVPLVVLAEPQPGQGPLQALGHLMERHRGERLLVCPVDMPWLDGHCLRVLQRQSERAPDRIHVADDGARLQLLLGVYPATPELRHSMAAWLAAGHRSLHSWLSQHPPTPVRLPAAALRNCNHPADAAALALPLPGPAAQETLVNPAPRAAG